jgi:murein DD-endopeptidase MepM/ murein hydrolase activator NlpD
MNKTLKVLLPTFYIGIIGVMILCTLLVINGVKNYLKEDIKYNFAVEGIFDNESVPVSKTGSSIIVKPYISEDISITKNYYDYKSDKDSQKNAIIYYKGTYFQNNGVDYESENDFEIVSILDGEVISIEDSEIYGKVLTIKHNDNLISVYSNIKDVLVSVGYKTTTGEIIATSNKSIYESDEKSLLHFEVYFKNKSINPESIYTLSVSELE